VLEDISLVYSLEPSEANSIEKDVRSSLSGT
jgi:hypothetical protein